MSVITRFAPSPTGYLHIGGARTALFNYLFARHHGGQFLLRVEDTDHERSTDDAKRAILDGLRWLGIEWDGEVVYQSSRAARHREVAEAMVAAGHAYYCYTTPAELAAERAAAEARGDAFRYARTWRNRSSSDAPDGVAPVIRIKAPLEHGITIADKVQGEVHFPADALDDFVILRSDGTPTYMLAVVVDDHDMGITHIIRGDDHLNNAGRQSIIYQAMGWDIPLFAHIPLIHGSDGAKLSKRHGALGVEAYRDMGYVPPAMCNYLLRLGWAHGDEEIIDRDKAIALFGLEGIGKSPARLDMEKLNFVNAQYLRQQSAEELFELVSPALTAGNNAITGPQKTMLLGALPLLVARAHTIPELAAQALPFIRRHEGDEKAEAALNKGRAALPALADALEAADSFDSAGCKAAIMTCAEALGRKPGEVMPPLRAALLGVMSGPDIPDILSLLGKNEALARIRAVC